MPKHVIIMVNDKDACNISCTHCFLPYKGKRSPEDTKDLIARLQEEGYSVGIAGSELLLDEKYIPALGQAKQRYVLTNGILLKKKPELYDMLRENGVEEIRMSLHFGIQKELRSVPQTIVERVCSDAKDRSFQVQIATSITAANHTLIPEMCKVVYTMGADTLKLINYVNSGSATTQDMDALTPEQKRNVFSLVQEARQRYTKDQLAILLHGNFGPRPGTKGAEAASCNTYCPAGKELLVIDPQNKVYGCPFLMQQQIGKLTDAGIEVDTLLHPDNRDRCLTDYLWVS